MKISIYSPTYASLKNNNKKEGFSTVPFDAKTQPKEQLSYPAVYFTGKFNPQRLTPKNINISAEKEKLIKKFDNILKNDITEKEMTKEELNLYYQIQANEYSLRLMKKLQDYEREVNLLINYAQRGQYAWEQGMRIQKEVLKIQRNLDNPPKIKPPQHKQNPMEADTDFVLINKFKSAAIDDNFDFKNVYKSYYSGLNDIKSLRELKHKYPKIKIPKNPKEVVSKKIEESFTRELYENIDKLVKETNPETVKAYVSGRINAVLEEQLKKSKPEIKSEIARKIIPTTITRVKRRYWKLKENNAISTVPETKKIKQPLITENDKKLLTVDYNNFVLYVLKEQYLNGTKPNEIVYKYNKGRPGKRVEYKLSVNELRDSEYKFPKPAEKFKLIFSHGEELKFAQRNYDYFSKEELLERLEFHPDRQKPNEKYLDTLISFSTSRFEPDDIEMMKKFLRESDEAIDGKKSIKEVVEFIDRNNISPKGTERINEIERQKQIEQLKAEQKLHAKLNHIQTKFDDHINLLYMNDMAYTADLCSQYRPTDLDAVKNKKADEILKIISKYINPEDETEILNKDRMALNLTRWKKYSDYCESSEPDEIELLKKAQVFAKGKKGEINSDKAGQYLINAEAVKAYPGAFEYARNREAADSIMKHFEGNKEKAVEYLCKYDDYLDMSATEKTKISNILKIFDKKDSFDKTLLKPIIENEYVKTNTTDIATMNEKGSKKVKATIGTTAKSEILDYYKFPKCLDYFEDFEYALPQFATTFGRQGIKKLDTNFYELKIMGKTDRLLARNGEYIFNEFDPTGLH